MVGHFAITNNSREATIPRMMPAVPPITLSSEDSTRNCRTEYMEPASPDCF